MICPEISKPGFSVIGGMIDYSRVGIIPLIVWCLQVGCDSNDQGRLPREESGAVASIEVSELGQAFMDSAREVLHEEIPLGGLAEVLGKGLWNSDCMAVAISIRRPQPKASQTFIFLYQPDETFLAYDASGVEGGNFGKLGIPGRERCECYETTPIKWLYRDDGYFRVVIQTRAWKDGQRYTVAEPLVIWVDGFLFSR